MELRIFFSVLSMVLAIGIKVGQAGMCDRPVKLPDIKSVRKDKAVTGQPASVSVVVTSPIKPKEIWLTKSEDAGGRYVPVDLNDYYMRTRVLGYVQLDDYDHRFHLRAGRINQVDKKIWNNLYFYLMVEDACHNIHLLVNTDDAVTAFKANGTLSMPTIHRAPLKRYFPEIGKEFIIKIEASESFGKPFLDLNDPSPLQGSRLHAAHPGYSFFEKAFWSNVQEFGVWFRSGKPWLPWAQQYPQNTRPANVHIVKRRYNDASGSPIDLRMAVFDPFARNDVGIYETRLKVGLQYNIEVRIYSELMVSGSAKSEFEIYPALSFIPCGLYPSMVDAEEQKIHPDGELLKLGVLPWKTYRRSYRACFLELSTNKQRMILRMKRDDGQLDTPVAFATIKYGTVYARYYSLHGPSEAGKQYTYTYKDQVRTKNIIVGTHEPVKLSLQPQKIDYQRSRGKDLKIRCTAKGVPMPTVIFKRKTKNGNLVPMVGNRYRTRLQLNSKRNMAKATLTIRNFSFVDAFPPYEWGVRGYLRTGVPADTAKGNYGIYCFARNGYSSAAEVVSVDHGNEVISIPENETELKTGQSSEEEFNNNVGA